MEFSQSLDEYVDKVMPTYVGELKRLVRIPSISQDPERLADISKVLEEASSIIDRYGFRAQIIETRGNPALVAQLEVDPNAPWVTVYNHMDVQPAREPQRGDRDPFEPTEEDGKIVGRGTTDDKGPALSIVHAINFLRENNFGMPNIQVIYETEEEIGSPNFGKFLDDNHGVLKNPDSILISDTIFRGDNPALTYRLRGLVRATVHLTTGSEDLHSGMVGGAVTNPLNVLTYALGQCVDHTGQIKVPGFYDGVVSPKGPEGRELEELCRVAELFDSAKFKDDINDSDLYTTDPLDILRRSWHKPTFEIHGYAGGQCEEYGKSGKLDLRRIKTAIPYEAVAKISMRLVPGQKPAKVIENLATYLQTFHSKIEVKSKGGVEASVTELDNPFMRKAAEACRFGFGKPALCVGTGGTIGSVPQFQRVYPDRAIVLLAQSLMSDGYHAPNEHFELKQAANGIKTMAKYLHSIAQQRAA